MEREGSGTEQQCSSNKASAHPRQGSGVYTAHSLVDQNGSAFIPHHACPVIWCGLPQEGYPLSEAALCSLGKQQRANYWRLSADSWNKPCIKGNVASAFPFHHNPFYVLVTIVVQ